jgi:hypothetical protein
MSRPNFDRTCICGAVGNGLEIRHRGDCPLGGIRYRFNARNLPIPHEYPNRQNMFDHSRDRFAIWPYGRTHLGLSHGELWLEPRGEFRRRHIEGPIEFGNYDRGYYPMHHPQHPSMFPESWGPGRPW